MRGRAILINDDYEVKVSAVRNSSGKIVSGVQVGKTLYQNQALILLAKKGAYKEQPAMGVGIEGVLLDNDYLEWRRKIRLQLELDGQKVNEIKFSAVHKLVIDADYNS